MLLEFTFEEDNNDQKTLTIKVGSVNLTIFYQEVCELDSICFHV
jgi:hypothetical protein